MIAKCRPHSLNSVFCTFMHGIGFVRMEDEVALVTFIAEGVRKVLRLNMVPHVGLGSKCKTADSATSCTNFISRNKLVKVLKFLDTSLN